MIRWKFSQFILILSIVTLILSGCAGVGNTNKNLYQDALNYYNEENYQEAYEIFKSLENYKDSVSMLRKCQYMLANKFMENGNYTEAISFYNELDEYEDCKEKLIEAYCQLARDAYEQGDYNTAYKYYGCATSNQSDLPEDNYYLESEFLSKIQGKYIYEHWEMEVSVKGTKFYRGDDVYEIIPEKQSDGKVIGVLEGDWYEDSYIRMSPNGNVIYLVDRILGGAESMWIRDSVYNQKNIVEEKEPCIGMSAEEVKQSTWGEPQDINRTTYSWGVTEQWCYSGYRYIYFEDGVVTAISE